MKLGKMKAGRIQIFEGLLIPYALPLTMGRSVVTICLNLGLLVLLHLILGRTISQGKPIALHPLNPHYFLYKEKPTILVSSGEHYGSVMNLDFNYAIYLDELHSKGLNLTRTLTGVYVEPSGAFNIEENTMAPAAGRFICPWRRSSTPGYAKGGNKFDLSNWDEAYFKRLKDFVSAAGKRGVIVELALFCPFYEETQWKLSPMNPINNINNMDTLSRNNVYTLDKSGGLLAVQEKLVRKIVQELKGFDNLVYEICNEPYFGGVTMQWQHHIADIIRASEKDFKYPHLLTQNISNGASKVIDPHPGVSVFNFHYANPPYAVALNYGLNKVIGDNETGFAGNADETYRKEGWQFLLSGGGLYNNLDYSFTVGHEKGDFVYPSTQPGGGSSRLRAQLGYLKDFLHRFDFINMRPDSTLLKGGSGKNRAYSLAEPGRQYAIYLPFVLNRLELTLPAGTYQVEWIDPVKAESSKPFLLEHPGAIAALDPPPYEQDIAVRIVSDGAGNKR